MHSERVFLALFSVAYWVKWGCCGNAVKPRNRRIVTASPEAFVLGYGGPRIRKSMSEYSLKGTRHHHTKAHDILRQLHDIFLITTSLSSCLEKTRS
jgi:hypothetical protein